MGFDYGIQIVVKGIVTAEDASEAVRQGVDGIWVSNHGARQLDTTPATVEALPEVRHSSLVLLSMLRMYLAFTARGRGCHLFIF